MKRMLSILLAFLLMVQGGSFLFNTKMINAADEPAVVTLSATKNVLLADVGVQVDLSGYQFTTETDTFDLSQVVWNTLPSEVNVTDHQLVASSVGIFTFSFKSNEVDYPVYLITKNQEDTEYVIFQDSYSDLPDGGLPNGYTLETSTGTAGIENGKLFLDALSTSPTRVLLPSYLQAFKNYIIETDFTIEASNEATRWASFMYRFNTQGYYQMAIRHNATLSNGVEFAKWINNGWNVPRTTSYKEPIDGSKMYRLKIDLKGDEVKEYINDELQITYEQAVDYNYGMLGMQASGSKALYNNILIKLPVDYINVAGYEYKPMANVYTHDSGIILAPTVAQWIWESDDFARIEATEKPQVITFFVDGALDVKTPTGQAITSLSQALKDTDGRFIPAIVPTNETAAVAIATFLKNNAIRDVFVVSAYGDVIRAARAENSAIRGIYMVNYNANKPTLTDDDLLSIRDRTNASGAKVVLLPKEYLSKHNVEYLQKRLVSVWGNIARSDEFTVWNTVLTGVNGILTDSFESVYPIYDYFPENTMIRRPLIIGHRGIPTKAPENSMASFRLAYDEGADVIELDIYLTTDGKLAVMHDSTTVRTTGTNLVVESSTMEQLKALTLTDSIKQYTEEKIPTLDEVFEEFKGKDVQIFIEIKSAKPEITEVLNEVVTSYDMSSQISVITFNTSQVELMHQNMPGISVGYLNTSLASLTNLDGSLMNVLNTVTPIQATFNPNFPAVSKELIQQLHYRGVTTWPWTFDKVADNTLYYGYGVGGNTTNYTQNMTNEWNRYQTSSYEFSVDLKDEFTPLNIRGIIETQGGMTYDYIPVIDVISGEETEVTINDQGVVTSIEKPGSIYLLTSFTTTFTNGTKFTLYDSLVHITVIDTTVIDPGDDDPIDDPDDEPTTDEFNWGTVGAVGGGVLLLLLVAVGVFVYFKKFR